MKQYGFFETTMPASTFKNQPQPIKCVGDSILLMVNKNLPEHIACKLTKPVCEGKEQLARTTKALNARAPEKTWEPARIGGIPLHPGAARYFKEKGWLNKIIK